MQHYKLRLGWALAFVCTLAGCQPWHSQLGVSGLGLASGERKIVKQAQNDPFPSPAEVGMK